MRVTLRPFGYFKAELCGLLTAVLSLTSYSAKAEGCSSALNLTPCFDANALWLPAGETPFLSLPFASEQPVGRLYFALTTELLHNPVLAHVASPDPRGRDVHLVEDALDASLSLAIEVACDLELSVVLPTRLYQNGAGAAGLNSQSGSPIEQSALRDPRLGVAYSWSSLLATSRLGLRSALDVSLPLGNDAALAGERSLVIVPDVTVDVQGDVLALAASVGMRVRRTSEFGDLRLGTQAFVALGGGADLLAPGVLFLSVEGYALPPLQSTRAPTANSALPRVLLLPAEWLVAARSSLQKGNPWSLSLSFGTGLPLSSETRSSATGSHTSYFLGLTSPEWRTVLSVRWSPQIR